MPTKQLLRLSHWLYVCKYCSGHKNQQQNLQLGTNELATWHASTRIIIPQCESGHHHHTTQINELINVQCLGLARYNKFGVQHVSLTAGGHLAVRFLERNSGNVNCSSKDMYMYTAHWRDHSWIS